MQHCGNAIGSYAKCLSLTIWLTQLVLLYDADITFMQQTGQCHSKAGQISKTVGVLSHSEHINKFESGSICVASEADETF